MVIISEKPTVGTPKLEREEHKHTNKRKKSSDHMGRD